LKRYVSQTTEFGILDEDDAHITSPKAILEHLVENDLIEQYLVSSPYFNAIVLPSSKDQLKIRAIAHHNDLIFVVDGLSI
jgi:hypothetical protein